MSDAVPEMRQVPHTYYLLRVACLIVTPVMHLPSSNHQAAPASEVRSRAAAPPPPPRVMGAVFDEVSHSLGGGNPEAARAVWTERWEFVRGSVDWDNCALSQRFIAWGRTYCDELHEETPPPSHPLEATPAEERIWGWGVRVILFGGEHPVINVQFLFLYRMPIFRICATFG